MKTQLPPLSLKPFGSTGLSVTPICIGGAPLGDMPETFDYGVPLDRALETIRAAFDSPINFFDTAAAYGDGESEVTLAVSSLSARSREA